MDISIWIPIVACVVGAFLFILATPGDWRPKIAEMGRLAFFAGLLVALFHLAGHALRISA